MAKKLRETWLKRGREEWRAFDFSARPEGTLFTHLASAIVSQQLSLKAAATIYGRFRELFPRGRPTPQATLELPIPRLRSVGLSQAKALALLDLAQKSLEGVVPSDVRARRMTDHELIERLTAVRGVGKWTVEMVLIFRYRRPDVWPVDDLGVQKGFRLLFPEARFEGAKALSPLGAQWEGRRTEIAWYCWRALEAQAAQTWESVPVRFEGKSVTLWLKGGAPVRLGGKAPRAGWPGMVKTSAHRRAHWQRRLDQSGRDILGEA